MEKLRENRLKVIRGGKIKRNRVWRRMFAFGILVLTGFLLWNSLGYLTLLVADVTVARHSEVVTGEPVHCIVLRNERELLAPAEGNYIALVANGTRVRVGQVIARIEGSAGSIDVLTDAAGLVWHGRDSLGGLSIMDRLNSQAVAQVAEYMENPSNPSESRYVSKNQAVAAIVDNARFQIITGLSFHTDKRQTLKIQDDNAKEISVVITPKDVLQSEYRYWVLWDAGSLPDHLGLKRDFSAQLITARQQMVLIPEGALYSKEGEKGVFVLHRNKPVFNPVATHHFEDGYVGVTGLANGQRVLSLPKWVSFAKRWWLN